MSEVVIRLPFRFNFDCNKAFRFECERALQATKAGQSIELDFQDVEYLDSSALGMLVLLSKQATEQSVPVLIKNARGTALDILKLANMQRLFGFSQDGTGRAHPGR